MATGKTFPFPGLFGKNNIPITLGPGDGITLEPGRGYNDLILRFWTRREDSVHFCHTESSEGCSCGLSFGFRIDSPEAEDLLILISTLLRLKLRHLEEEGAYARRCWLGSAFRSASDTEGKAWVFEEA